MDLSLLKQLYRKGYFSVHEGFDDWRCAIEVSVLPLVERGIVEDTYAGRIINNIDQIGPYICIAPHICIPHAEHNTDIHKTTLCFMKCNRAVIFGDTQENQAELFFVLASVTPDEHINQLGLLVETLEQEDLIQLLLETKTLAEFDSLLKDEV